MQRIVFSETATSGLLLNHLPAVLRSVVFLCGVCWFMCYLVFELVWVFVLLLVQVNEIVCDALLAAWIHVPADLEGVAGDVTDLDVLRDRKFLHLRDTAILGFTSCEDERTIRDVDSGLYQCQKEEHMICKCFVNTHHVLVYQSSFQFDKVSVLNLIFAHYDCYETSITLSFYSARTILSFLHSFFADHKSSILLQFLNNYSTDSTYSWPLYSSIFTISHTKNCLRSWVPYALPWKHISPSTHTYLLLRTHEALNISNAADWISSALSRDGSIYNQQ